MGAASSRAWSGSGGGRATVSAAVRNAVRRSASRMRGACRGRRLGAERAQAIRGVTQRGAPGVRRRVRTRRAGQQRGRVAPQAGEPQAFGVRSGGRGGGGACGTAPAAASSATTDASVTSTTRKRSIVEANRSIVDHVAPAAFKAPRERADYRCAPFRSTRGDRMKLSLARSSCALALALCTAGPAVAQDVTFTFTGTLTESWTSPFPELTPGTPFAGCYTVNLATPDIERAPTGSSITGTPARPTASQLQIGSHAFRTDTTSPTPMPPFLVELVNDQYGQDNYLLRSYYNLPTDGWQVEHISWQLDDLTQQQLSSTALTGGAAGAVAVAADVRADDHRPRQLVVPARPDRRRAGGAVPADHHHAARGLPGLQGRKGRRGLRVCRVCPVSPDLPDRRGFRGRRVSLDHRASLAAPGRRARLVHRARRALPAPPGPKVPSALPVRRVKACSPARW